MAGLLECHGGCLLACRQRLHSWLATKIDDCQCYRSWADAFLANQRAHMNYSLFFGYDSLTNDFWAPFSSI
jgi:hypothetical protein